MPLISRPNQKNALGDIKHRAVRDLAWCCFSAPMMKELPGSDTFIFPFAQPDTWQWLYELDQNPQKLLHHLESLKSTRLGIYYEALWHFYFENHPEWELLQHNLQIDRKGITLGAFDFLCRHDNDYWHIETAVKFYLFNPNESAQGHGWNSWIGPSAQDRLDLKLNHLRNHQLPLHQTAEGKAVLEAMYPQVSRWNTGLCLQGYLFSPQHQQAQPEFSHPQHGRGRWFFAREMLQELINLNEMQWTVLERNQWLAPAQTDDVSNVLTNEQLAEKIGESIAAERPLLVAAIKVGEQVDTSMPDVWREESRVFIVPDNWPDQSARPGIATPSRNT